jgi:hypothetical protein
MLIELGNDECVRSQPLSMRSEEVILLIYLLSNLMCNDGKALRYLNRSRVLIDSSTLCLASSTSLWKIEAGSK